MIKLLNYNLNSDYEDNKNSLEQLNHYCALTKDNNLIHLKNVNKDISYILNYKIANDSDIALYLTHVDLYKSVKIDGREISLFDKERIPYTCQKYNNGVEAATEILSNIIMDSETGQMNPKYNIYENYTEDKQGTIEVVLQDNLTPQNLYGIFLYNTSLTSIPKDMLNVISKDCTNMCGMFIGCISLTSLDLSNFDTSNVTDMSGMFEACSGLTSLDLSNFNTSNVTDMNGMFNNCTKLTELDVSKFDTSNVTNMSNMFSSCSGLTSLDLSNFNTSNVTNMNGMFYECGSLTSLNLSNFDTSNVTDISYMFYYCYSLNSLDLSNFNTSNVTKMYGMFSGCNKLTHIKCKQAFKDWCITNKINLPTAMQDGTVGTDSTYNWEIIDLV